MLIYGSHLEQQWFQTIPKVSAPWIADLWPLIEDEKQTKC